MTAEHSPGWRTHNGSPKCCCDPSDRMFPFLKVWVWHADHDDCSDFVMVGVLDGCQPPIESL